jgi:hypothetical protein
MPDRLNRLRLESRFCLEMPPVIRLQKESHIMQRRSSSSGLNVVSDASMHAHMPCLMSGQQSHASAQVGAGASQSVRICSPHGVKWRK